tara:strand:+ start:232 stop:1020 length:789 start_codon:yes stop_codon:yes gene_type:complete
MKMKIAIPSYNRYETIQSKSIDTLLNGGYEAKDIDVFVADEEQYILYKEKIVPDISIIIAVKGLKEVREFIFNYYEQGQHLLCLDDDIEDIREYYLTDDNKPRLRSVTNIKEIVDLGFRLCEERSLKLWGLYPCPNNAMWMGSQKDFTYDYRFIIGNFFGCINCSYMNKLNVPDIDDYERSIRSYLSNGGSLRMNHLSAKTKFRKNVGGQQDTEDRQVIIEESKKILLETYPNLLYLRKRKEDTNPILKDKRTLEQYFNDND